MLFEYASNIRPRFHVIKKQYKAKYKTGNNTPEDDINFKVALKREEARLEKLEEEFLRARGPANRYLRLMRAWKYQRLTQFQ